MTLRDTIANRQSDCARGRVVARVDHAPDRLANTVRDRHVITGTNHPRRVPAAALLLAHASDRDRPRAGCERLLREVRSADRGFAWPPSRSLARRSR